MQILVASTKAVSEVANKQGSNKIASAETTETRFRKCSTFREVYGGSSLHREEIIGERCLCILIRNSVSYVYSDLYCLIHTQLN